VKTGVQPQPRRGPSERTHFLAFLMKIQAMIRTTITTIAPISNELFIGELSS